MPVEGKRKKTGQREKLSCNAILTVAYSTPQRTLEPLLSDQGTSELQRPRKAELEGASGISQSYLLVVA